MDEFSIENFEISIDNEFWADFVQEAFEHVEDIETNVIELEQNPENMDIIHTMFRAFHTIKGLSGFVEHIVIQEIAHKTETMMDLCRKEELKVNKSIVDAILKSSDYIRQLCEDIESARNKDYLKEIAVHIDNLEKLSNPNAEITATDIKQTPIETEPEELTERDQPSEESIAEAEIISEEISLETKIQEEDQKEDIQTELPNKELEEVKKEDIVSETKQPKGKKAPKKTEINEEIESEELPPTVKVEPEPEVETKTIQNISAVENNQEQKESSPQGITKNIAPPEEHMKVANSKIDHLVELIGELIINQSLLERNIEAKYSNDNELIAELSSFLRITRDLQHLSSSLRMVSFKPTFQKLSRIARDTIQELHKDVEFVVSGESTEIDRSVTDKLLDPLVHLIKNAISHGVEEDTAERIKNNKPKKARVELNAFSKRGKIYIQIIDDGKGINTDIVHKKALEKGLIDPHRNYSKEEIQEFILLPGFSTAAKVDNISGRGVGMDVVKTQIQRLAGKVDIKSELGKGSTFTLEVPVNHAIMNGTIIQIEDQQFIVPTINVKEILQPLNSQWVFTQNKRTMIKVRNDIIPLIPQSTIFGLDNKTENPKLVVLLELDQELKALPITNVINRQEVVVKPVGQEFSDLKYISGMSILGNGRVSLILDIDYLFKKEVTNQ